MIADVAIRRALSTDLPRLLLLYRLLEVVPEPKVPLDEALVRLRELECNPLHQIYVAEVDQRIVGTFVMVFIPGLSHSARASCIVEDVVVDDALQGAGIGRRMMRFAMDLCAARDCYKLTLSSHVRRDQAHRFYEGLGFTRHGYSFLIDDAAGRSNGDATAPPSAARD